MKLQSDIRSGFAVLMLAIAASTFHVPAAGAEAAASPTGTWKWSVPNPDGRIPDMTFTLKQQGKTLMGTLTRSSGTSTLTNGVVNGDTVSFQIVRESRGALSTTTYTGKLSGDTIKGKVEIDTHGKQIASDWEVKRVGK